MRELMYIAALWLLLGVVQAGPMVRQKRQAAGTVCRFRFSDAVRGRGRGLGRDAGLYAGLDPADIAMGRLDGQQARLKVLQDQFSQIQADFNALTARGSSANTNLNRVSGQVLKAGAGQTGSCKTNYLQCGGSQPQCVNRLLVCDGIVHCPNGADESAATCTTLAPQGAVFEGKIPDADPCSRRKPTSMRAVVTSDVTAAFYQARPRLTIAMVLTYNQDGGTVTETLGTTGNYDYTNKRLTVDPPENDNLGLTCDFDGATNDRCFGQMVNQLTGQVCTTFFMRRRDA